MIFAACPLELVEGINKNEPPLVDADKISLNGLTIYDGYEDFVLLRIPDEGILSCKTSGQPCDPAVCAVLAVVASHAPDYITIESDGSVESWDHPAAWASGVLDRFIPNPIA